MSNPNTDRAAMAAFPVADAHLRRRVVGHYRDGHTWVTWHLAGSTDGRRWEIVSESESQVKADEAEAALYMGLPALITELTEVELALDAALHPTFDDISHDDTLALLNEAHARLRRVLGMPAAEPISEGQS